MNNKLKPALLGGLIVGFLSAIHSLIPLIGFCCCIWSILGGGLAAFLYIKGSSVPVKLADGAIVGALAGVVGGIIYVVIYLPFSLLYGMAVSRSNEPQRVEIPFSRYLRILEVFGSICRVFVDSWRRNRTAIFQQRKATDLHRHHRKFSVGPGGYGSGI